MIVSLKHILQLAESTGSAVAAFNVTSFDGIRSVLDAAEETKRPVILQFAPAAHEVFIPFKEIGPVMMFLAERASVPVCVHLDHGADLSEVKAALDMGFTGVMYDGSALPYDQNVANTVAAVEVARRYGASVEAEIGSMGREESESANGEGVPCESQYTDPDIASRFVRETGIDALACSFGTVHGIYVSDPVLDFPRIKAIREKTNVPVVMHGGSGISDSDFRRCIENGVRKINFYTYAAKYAGEAVRDSLSKKTGNVFGHDVYVTLFESMKRTYIKTIDVFSSHDE